MRQEVPLPPQFRHMAGQLHYVQQVSSTEYSASCPQCGGEVHQSGEWPDRLRIFVDDKPLMWCRRCDFLQFPDSQQGYEPPTLQEIEHRRQALVARAEADKRSAERALELLCNGQLWESYYGGAVGRRYWLRRGVPDVWQGVWRLGWVVGRRFCLGGEDRLVDAATIPLFGHDWAPLNIKYRLEPAPDEGKYRYELAGQAQPLFMCDPEHELGGHVIAVEGEIKSMVTYVTMDDAKATIVGLPGTNPSPSIVEQLRQADRITLVMDPGAKPAGVKLAREIGIGKTWLLETPMKVDDGILETRMTARELATMLKGALKLSAFVTK